MKDIEYWIWLSRIEGLNPKFLNNLLEKYNNPKEIWNKTKEELIEDGIKEKHASEITNSNYRQNLDKYLKYMNENNIQIITIKDKEYPDKLKVIYDPPVVLYVKGNKNILNEKSVAMVGCRLCTKYGQDISKKIAYNLSLNNINVISGLAKGIDSFAHKGCLVGKAKTIAVVGCGLDRVYPEENIGLFKTELISFITCFTGFVLGSDSMAKISKRINIYKDNNVFNTNHYEREELLTYIKENDSQIAKLDIDYKELSMQISELDKSREKSETKEFFEFDPIKEIQVDEEERKQKIQGQYREHDGRLVPQSGIYSDIEDESELEQAMNPLHAKPDSYYQNVYGCSCEEYVKRKTLKR